MLLPKADARGKSSGDCAIMMMARGQRRTKSEALWGRQER